LFRIRSVLIDGSAGGMTRQVIRLIDLDNFQLLHDFSDAVTRTSWASAHWGGGDEFIIGGAAPHPPPLDSPPPTQPSQTKASTACTFTTARPISSSASSKASKAASTTSPLAPPPPFSSRYHLLFAFPKTYFSRTKWHPSRCVMVSTCFQGPMLIWEKAASENWWGGGMKYLYDPVTN
jgi:hypothetical protein